MVVVARFMNGDELEVHKEEVTVNDIRIAAANIRELFAPEITVLFQGIPLTDEDACIARQPGNHPTIVHVVVQEHKNKDDDFWTNSMRAHVKGQDTDGALRALKKMPHTTQGECLWIETHDGNIEVVRFLLQAGSLRAQNMVDYEDEFGRSSLIIASLKGHKDIACMLLKAGADINHVDHRGISSLTYAAWEEQGEIVKLLLIAGADVNRVDAHYNSCLMVATRCGRTDIVRMLLNAGAYVDQVNRFGASSITDASRLGHKEIFDMLVRWRGCE